MDLWTTEQTTHCDIWEKRHSPNQTNWKNPSSDNAVIRHAAEQERMLWDWWPSYKAPGIPNHCMSFLVGISQYIFPKREGVPQVAYPNGQMREFRRNISCSRAAFWREVWGCCIFYDPSWFTEKTKLHLGHDHHGEHHTLPSTYLYYRNQRQNISLSFTPTIHGFTHYFQHVIKPTQLSMELS